MNRKTSCYERNVKGITTSPPQARLINRWIHNHVLCYEKGHIFMKNHKRANTISAAGAFYNKCKKGKLHGNHFYYDKLIEEVTTSPPEALLTNKPICL